MILTRKYQGFFNTDKSVNIYYSDRAEEQVNWPNDRGIQDINELYGDVNGKSIEGLIFDLPQHTKILDVGPGRGRLAKEINSQHLVNWHGITTTRVDEENLACFKEVTYAYVPENREWLERHFRSFSFGLDTYASLTYSNNPLHALLYIVLVMAPQGQFYSMSSLIPEDTENSCFGDSNTRIKIRDFFANIGVNLNFDLVKIKSKACAPGTYMDDLRISFQIPAEGLHLSTDFNGDTPWEVFNKLCELADQKIGIPAMMDNKTSFKAGQYHITMRNYTVNSLQVAPRIGKVT